MYMRRDQEAFGRYRVADAGTEEGWRVGARTEASGRWRGVWWTWAKGYPGLVFVDRVQAMGRTRRQARDESARTEARGASRAGG